MCRKYADGARDDLRSEHNGIISCIEGLSEAIEAIFADQPRENSALREQIKQALAKVDDGMRKIQTYRD